MCSHLTALKTGALGAFSIKKQSGMWHVYYSQHSKHKIPCQNYQGWSHKCQSAENATCQEKMRAGKTSEKGHTASHLLLFLRCWQLVLKELFISLPGLTCKKGIWNEKLLRFVASRLVGEGPPLVFSPLFQHLSKMLSYPHAFVVGTEVGENSTTCDVTCDHCHHPVWFLWPCTTLQSLRSKLFTSTLLRFRSLKLT